MDLPKFKKPIDEQIVTKLIYYLQNYYKNLSKGGHHKILVAIDGEVNSFVAAKMLRQTATENVAALVFDLGNSLWTDSAVEYCEKLGLDTFTLDRAVHFREQVSAYRLHTKTDIKYFFKRFINYHLLIAADNMRAAVLDITDKSDRLLGLRPEGFYGHLMPFYSLYKSEILDLAKFLNLPDQIAPIPIYQDIPYPDDDSLTYDKVDSVLYLLTEKQLTPEEISQNYNIDLHWLKRLKSHIDKYSLKTTVSQFLI